MLLRLLIAGCSPGLAENLKAALAQIADTIQLQVIDDDALIEAVGSATPDLVIVGGASAAALFRRHRQIEQELAAAQRSLADRLTIDDAKAWLIRERRLSEPAAHRWLQRRAMNEGRRIVDIARNLLENGN